MFYVRKRIISISMNTFQSHNLYFPSLDVFSVLFFPVLHSKLEKKKFICQLRTFDFLPAQTTEVQKKNQAQFSHKRNVQINFLHHETRNMFEQ